LRDRPGRQPVRGCGAGTTAKILNRGRAARCHRGARRLGEEAFRQPCHSDPGEPGNFGSSLPGRRGGAVRRSRMRRAAARPPRKCHDDYRDTRGALTSAHAPSIAGRRSRRVRSASRQPRAVAARRSGHPNRQCRAMSLSRRWRGRRRCTRSRSHWGTEWARRPCRRPAVPGRLW
jgi:hypothetical protein